MEGCAGVKTVMSLYADAETGDVRERVALCVGALGDELGAHKDSLGGGRGLRIDGGRGAIGGRWGDWQWCVLRVVAQTLSPQHRGLSGQGVDAGALWTGVGDENGERSE